MTIVHFCEIWYKHRIIRYTEVYGSLETMDTEKNNVIREKHSWKQM